MHFNERIGTPGIVEGIHAGIARHRVVAEAAVQHVSVWRSFQSVVAFGRPECQSQQIGRQGFCVDDVPAAVREDLEAIAASLGVL